jgi:uncharacterized protein YdcH (DUF465 family)
MNVEPHDVDHEFPELHEAILRLKAESPEFARVCAGYDRVDREVHVIEEQDVPVSDVAFEDMKKLRVKLKDELYAMLRSSRA